MVFSQTTGHTTTGQSAGALLSSYRHKVNARKDSLLAAEHKTLPATNNQVPITTNQQPPTSTPRPDTTRPREEENPDNDDGFSLDHISCKNVGGKSYWITDTVPVQRIQVSNQPKPGTPFLTVHGNILYNVNYYSNIDTPYNEKNIYQHTVQTYLDILVKGKYPMRIYLTNRFSNSALFRNFSDFNFSYSNTQFNQLVKDQVRRQFLASMPSYKNIDSLQKTLDADRLKLKGLEGWINNPALLQKMVEAKEREYFHAKAPEQNASSDTLSRKWPVSSSGSHSSAWRIPTQVDSALLKQDTTHLEKLLAQKKEQADSLRKRIDSVESKLQSARQDAHTDVNRVCAEIQQADNPDQLKKKMQEHHIPDSSLPKGYRTLMAIKSFSVGRSVVNYSELSVKNISINGVQAEYNPSNYYAAASGKVDYRFRDFIVQTPGQPRQYLNVLRYGKGLKDGNSIILTYFTGRRQLYNAATSDSPHTQSPSSALMGLTIEGNYKVTEHILLTGEVAKSSVPFYTADSSKGNGLVGQMFRMNDRSNEAWSVKATAFFPATQTRIKGSYKRLGINYQSFSIFTDGSSQTAWSGSIDQLFLHRWLDIMLSANTNDFSNPLISQQYKSTTVFKSIQATLRKPKWPVVSLGYFPSSQLTKLGNGQYIENLFYTLTGNLTHSYNWRHILMNSTMMYTRFYNRSADSGFVYFNTTNLLFSQSLFLSRCTLQANASAASNQDYRLYTMEGKGQYTINKYLSAGAGIKYNKQTVFNIEQLGYSAEVMLRLPKLGQVQFSADKGFIPGMNKQLVPNNTGRLSYFKTF